MAGHTISKYVSPASLLFLELPQTEVSAKQKLLSVVLLSIYNLHRYEKIYNMGSMTSDNDGEIRGLDSLGYLVGGRGGSKAARAGFSGDK